MVSRDTALCDSRHSCLRHRRHCSTPLSASLSPTAKGRGVRRFANYFSTCSPLPLRPANSALAILKRLPLDRVELLDLMTALPDRVEASKSMRALVPSGFTSGPECIARHSWREVFIGLELRNLASLNSEIAASETFVPRTEVLEMAEVSQLGDARACHVRAFEVQGFEIGQRAKIPKAGIGDTRLIRGDIIAASTVLPRES